MKITTGIDLIEVDRVKASILRHGNRFLNRIFTPSELAEAGASPTSLAARFAAKEAVAKALGTGIGKVGWLEMEILRGETGQPQIRLHGAARQLAIDLKLSTWSISLSHTKSHAIAIAVATES
jgi:holo-[acyl-carrier protein] synthase